MSFGSGDTPPDTPDGSPRKTILKASLTSPGVSADLSMSGEWSKELSYEVHEKSITRKLNLDSPARFFIQKNQRDEIDWVAESVFCGQAQREVHKKAAKARAGFCRRLRNDYPSRALHARLPYDESMCSVPSYADPRTAHHDDLVSWLQNERCHKKPSDYTRPGPVSPSGWTRTEEVSARTRCWEPTILARRATGMIWTSRLAADEGLKGPSDYLLEGERLPPRRKSTENRSRPGTVKIQSIMGVPSPRRLSGRGKPVMPETVSPSQRVSAQRGPVLESNFVARKSKLVALEVQVADTPVATPRKETADDLMFSSEPRYAHRDAIGRVVVEDGLARMVVSGVIAEEEIVGESAHHEMPGMREPPTTGMTTRACDGGNDSALHHQQGPDQKHQSPCTKFSPREPKRAATQFRLVESWDVSGLELHAQAHCNL